MAVTSRHSQYVNVTVEVDIADYLREAQHEELHDLGLHRNDNCAVELTAGAGG